MSDKSSRRDFLRSVSLAGAAVAVGGVAGCAKVAVRNDGVITIQDPELIKLFHEAWDEQVRAVRAGKSNRTGIRFEVPAIRPVAGQASAAPLDTTETYGKVPINNLCYCREGSLEAADSGSSLRKPK